MISLSPAQPEDVETLFALNKALIDRYEDTASIDYPRVLLWLRRNLETNLPHFRRITVKGKLAGFFSLVPGTDSWEIDSLFVLPEFQNQGLGTQVLNHCREATPLPLILYVFRENIQAVKLYRKLGFTVTQEVGKTRCIMTWNIPDC